MPTPASNRFLAPLLILLALTVVVGFAFNRLHQTVVAPPGEVIPVVGPGEVVADQIDRTTAARSALRDAELGLTNWDRAPRRETPREVDPEVYEKLQPAVEPRPSVTPSYTWHEDAAGYVAALEDARAERKPLIVYFHTDWCGYCRELERELLDTAQVDEYLKYLSKVRVNPETGATEKALAEKYGVDGYPALFVHSAALGPASKIRRGKTVDGERRLKTPEEYVETLRRAAS